MVLARWPWFGAGSRGSKIGFCAGGLSRTALRLSLLVLALVSPVHGAGAEIGQGVPHEDAGDLAQQQAPAPAPVPELEPIETLSPDQPGDRGDGPGSGWSKPRRIRHVVVIGIDGLGGMYLAFAATPVLDGLMRRGAWTLEMSTVTPSKSSPCWMSMISGVSPREHGVKSNDWRPGDSRPPATLFKQLRIYRPKAKIVVLHDWDGFGRLVEKGVADKMGSPGDSTRTIEAGIRIFLKEKPDLLFLQLDSLDGAGHKSGWGSKGYLRVLSAHDALIGKFLRSLEQADLLDETLILITADHGGKGKSHGGGSPQEMRIPFILIGPTVLNVHLQSQTRIYDIAATIAHIFRLPMAPRWIGKPILEALVSPEDGVSPPGPTTARKGR